MKKVLASLILAATFATGCATSGSLVPVKGKDAEVYHMRGEWVGEYSSSETGRSGAIRFALRAGRRTADGEVTMNLPSGEAKPLKIAYLKVEGDELIGKLATYEDPACSCAVETEFVGTMVGGAIEGTFTTKPVGKDMVMGGTWRAERLER